MINLKEEIEKVKKEGYNEANAESLVCQDIILYAIANSSMNRNVTIKGGVVMRNLSHDARRATQDIDMDFIRYSISDVSIHSFVENLKNIDGLSIELLEPLIELKHQDYKGKRIFIKVKDTFGNELDSKIDIGVQKDLDIGQEEYCFDICFQEDGVSLLMNSREQIITEKIKSFLRFGSRSTRYKDVFDICYLSKESDPLKLEKCFRKYIYDDRSLPVDDIYEIRRRLTLVFTDRDFIRSVTRSRKNWMDCTTEEAMERNLAFIDSLIRN
ncbi:MAG: nucleotidyl transferase AbiEii/AbiGii toxin family protein [Erysipelotrichaceae bacterium]|nr:nucleotidyl transferase AbiEii/AbiGii toxin family protein [Erysipelotrichaceae bacterium]